MRRIKSPGRLAFACGFGVLIAGMPLYIVTAQAAPRARQPAVMNNGLFLLAIAFWGTIAAVYALARYRVNRDPRLQPGHCGHCGYDLTGNVSGRCPECGAPVEA